MVFLARLFLLLLFLRESQLLFSQLDLLLHFLLESQDLRVVLELHVEVQLRHVRLYISVCKYTNTV